MTEKDYIEGEEIEYNSKVNIFYNRLYNNLMIVDKEKKIKIN